MKIAIPRPKDPDGQALWDEARRAIAARDNPCLCGKRTTCACRMRLPVVDVETGSDDE